MLQTVNESETGLVPSAGNDRAAQDAREVEQLPVQHEEAVSGLGSFRGCPRNDDLLSSQYGGRRGLSTI